MAQTGRQFEGGRLNESSTQYPVLDIEQDRNTSADSCFICLKSGGALKTYCGCEGAHGTVHFACLQLFLSITKKEECQHCRKRYPVIKSQSNVWKWKSPDNKPSLKAQFLLQAVIFFVGSFIVITYPIVGIALLKTFELQTVEKWVASGLIFGPLLLCLVLVMLGRICKEDFYELKNHNTVMVLKDQRYQEDSKKGKNSLQSKKQE